MLMKTVTIIEPSDVKFLQIDVGPRYWGDGSIKINGVYEDDVEWEEQKRGAEPKMPFATYDENASNKSESYRWQLTIDLENLKIIDWPKGVEANIHYKVCDDGTYYLLDENKEILAEKNCYVPDILSYIERGFGDYIIMLINGNGELEHFPKDNKNILIQKLIDTESF